MIQYGSTDLHELRFSSMRASIELRDAQWIDVEVLFELDLHQGSELPADLSELSALLICTYGGDIVQIVPQDEGRDCEYQFTDAEKEQLRQFYEQSVKQLLRLKVERIDNT
ncbi:hypothetical protein [Paenibacillus rigui]|uniref:Uncharacterized protein n=1 Tax=Paenibacillus rigui TaxID=554312 RepID=A0A229UWQ0_9BACL|nr:hypothetical protein [Paenibacillus rigui]OXM87848.1 hypothetical protein CF651_01685 [Paenibacillus rigui]